MKLKNILVIKSIVIAAAIASLVGLSFHIVMLREITPYVNKAMNEVTILKSPYPTYINIFAYITVIFPGLGLATIYYFLRPYFTTQSRFLRGVILGTLILLLEGELIRQPIMNILVGNPISVALLQQSQVWLTHYMAILVVFLMPETNFFDYLREAMIKYFDLETNTSRKIPTDEEAIKIYKDC
jgi:hypothetical protein